MGDIDRFWSKVAIGGDDECWPWTEFKTKKGYGHFWSNGRNVRAHRYALSLREPIPFKGAHAMHSCDNPSCCNPSHLSWGTNDQNNRDKISKGRQCRGENHRASIYTDEIADKILKLKVRGLSSREVAHEIGLTQSQVMNIFCGRSWKHRHGVNGNPTYEEIRRLSKKCVKKPVLQS